jgi:hypothetical protein
MQSPSETEQMYKDRPPRRSVASRKTLRHNRRSRWTCFGRKQAAKLPSPESPWEIQKGCYQPSLAVPISEGSGPQVCMEPITRSLREYRELMTVAETAEYLRIALNAEALGDESARSTHLTKQAREKA